LLFRWDVCRRAVQRAPRLWGWPISVNAFRTATTSATVSGCDSTCWFRFWSSHAVVAGQRARSVATSSFSAWSSRSCGCRNSTRRGSPAIWSVQARWAASRSRAAAGARRAAHLLDFLRARPLTLDRDQNGRRTSGSVVGVVVAVVLDVRVSHVEGRRRSRLRMPSHRGLRSRWRPGCGHRVPHRPC
jgi:hypothetical protein